MERNSKAKGRVRSFHLFRFQLILISIPGGTSAPPYRFREREAISRRLSHLSHNVLDEASDFCAFA
jgi:hypothetical protein